MHRPQKGICCAGCPHRAAYVVVKDAIGRGRGRVICGDAGCRAVGPMHPAATSCPGGQGALLPRYNQPVPAGVDICAHFALDADVAADGGARFSVAALAAEGDTALLCVMASSARYLRQDALDELGCHLAGLGYESVSLADPLDTRGTGDMLTELLEEGGVHAVVFASPCAQLLQRAPREAAEVERASCVGCQRCVQITGCPALSFRPPTAHINADLCASCDLCADYCRTRAIMTPRANQTPAQRHAARLAAAIA